MNLNGGPPPGSAPPGSCGAHGGTAPPVLTAVSLSKHFGKITAVDGVSFTIHAQEVVGLVGDNGAGKSTLVSLLCGALQPSEGSLLLDGKQVAFASPMEARAMGIETVYQDLSLAVDLPVWANVYLGRERLRPGILGRLGMLDHRGMIENTAAELEHLAVRLPSVTAQCDQLSGGQRQAVAVIRAIFWGTRLLLLDEPTANLGVEQQRHVADLVMQVKARGIPVLIVSHNLPQLHAIADRILVMFHGHLVAALDARTATLEEIVGWITGARVAAGLDPAVAANGGSA